VKGTNVRPGRTMYNEVGISRDQRKKRSAATRYWFSQRRQSIRSFEFLHALLIVAHLRCIADFVVVAIRESQARFLNHRFQKCVVVCDPDLQSHFIAKQVEEPA